MDVQLGVQTLDLRFGQTNGAIAVDAETGLPVFFDAQQYLDENGNVVDGYEDDYAAAGEANAILRTAASEWDPGVGPWLDNRCCDQRGAQDNCDTVQEGARCKMDDLGQWCEIGSIQCTFAGGG